MAAESGKVSERVEFVVFGASGFTGEYVVEELLRISGSSGSGPPFKFAVAGRSESKLKESLRKAFEQSGKEVRDIPIILADVGEENSLNEMCQRAKVVLNCVGPYRFYGEAVVKACIANKTHHIDISGEPQFLERMQLEYNEQAQKAGVYIVGACGFDSIPCEMGIQYLKEHFPGDVCNIETYFEIIAGAEGITYNYGTWHSAIYGYAYSNELKPLREKLFPTRLPKYNPCVPKKNVLFYSSDVDGWCLPFPGSDKSVVTRTQHFFYERNKQRPFLMSAFSKQGSLCSSLATIVMALIFALFTTFAYGRSLLEQYPQIFSFGSFKKTGPSRKQIKETSFTLTVIGVGYSDKLSEPEDNYTSPPNRKLVVKVKGPEPGYITTPLCMVQCGLVLLQELGKLPKGGGVLTAGSAYAKTTLIDRLKQAGMDFVHGDMVDLNTNSQKVPEPQTDARPEATN